MHFADLAGTALTGKSGRPGNSKRPAWLCVCVGLTVLLASGFSATTLRAAVLPAHDALRILVIGDEVNPNNLSDAELTQPPDFVPAFTAADSGLNLVPDTATLVDSQAPGAAITALESATPPNVVVYFAHRPAPDAKQQASLVSAFSKHLERGGGIVVFHHGIYAWAGKESVIELFGGHSDSIQWDTKTGQRVFNVAPSHFVTTNGVTYSAMADLSGVSGVKDGTYSYFDNTPDERYPKTTLTASGPELEILFASDSGGKRVLGYALSRAAWKGKVVVYQPGEYQPHALDDRKGPGFQILANAILYSTGKVSAATASASVTSGAAPGAASSGVSAANSATVGSASVAAASSFAPPRPAASAVASAGVTTSGDVAGMASVALGAGATDLPGVAPIPVASAPSTPAMPSTPAAPATPMTPATPTESGSCAIASTAPYRSLPLGLSGVGLALAAATYGLRRARSRRG